MLNRRNVAANDYNVINVCGATKKVNASRITLDNHRFIFSFIGKSTRFSTRLFLIVLPAMSMVAFAKVAKI
jgi:hypothetical protein